METDALLIKQIIMNSTKFINAKHNHAKFNNIFTFMELYCSMTEMYKRIKSMYGISSISCYNNEGERIMEVNDNEVFPIIELLFPIVNYRNNTIVQSIKRIIHTKKEIENMGDNTYAFYTPGAVSFVFIPFSPSY